ncbi:MAG: hypothetical protein IPH52_14000 [Leptospiraceae bacterium]|nr:hypothetical protein [Leptospiraceae bacterium]
MTSQYSEDNLIEQTAIDLFKVQLGWQVELAFNAETFGAGSMLGRENKTEILLRKVFLDKLKEFNPNLPRKPMMRHTVNYPKQGVTKVTLRNQF